MKDSILKPSPNSPPDVYGEGQLFKPIQFYKLVELQKDQELLDEHTILAGKQKNDLFSKLSTNEKDYLSLDYETWMRH